MDSFNIYIDKFSFLIELLIVEGLFLFPLNKRKAFFLRLLVALLICMMMAGILPFVGDNLINVSRYFILFCFTLLGMLFCFELSPSNALFYGVAAYAIQHCTYCLETILLPYAGKKNLIQVAFYIFFPLIVSGMLWKIFSKRLKVDLESKLNNTAFLTLSASIVTLTVILNYTRYLYLDFDNEIMHLVFSIYAIFSCLLALSLQFGLLQQSHLKQELQLIDYLWQQDKKQYEMEKDNIELINMKCHDMKHQLTLLRENPDLLESEKALDEMEEAIAIYDSFAKTGNSVLDTILSQKLLFCEKHKINLTYLITGENLDFIENMDLYSIFGNIIDNAIESVMQLDDKNMRVIGLNVSINNKLLSIHTENYYASTIIIENGLPKTTKNDNVYHGFGLKSVQMLVEKYNGHLNIRAEDEIFNLNILIPIP